MNEPKHEKVDVSSKEVVKEPKPSYISLVVEETKYKTLNTRKNQLRSKWTPPNIKEIKSYIPGTIIKVGVRKGDTVDTGDLLLEYEAMKMQNVVKAPFSGTIEEVFVKEGDRVPKGTIMLKYK
ncbi:MAG TPA: acetyl-CoA carboxylase biotin carboxyl carrier protein subunit [Tenuifilaceae bacterium]|nr:acetyl-CoA carboxylase biotin carboxyl carrier protein subunit [Tenuifilaceae bacterium]HPQ34701.1 acetyl-CoA carboxylase biotin carboxyl carrier protein subunit [Tenuifilaceae bacterium]